MLLSCCNLNKTLDEKTLWALHQSLPGRLEAFNGKDIRSLVATLYRGNLTQSDAAASLLQAIRTAVMARKDFSAEDCCYLLYGLSSVETLTSQLFDHLANQAVRGIPQLNVRVLAMLLNAVGRQQSVSRVSERLVRKIFTQMEKTRPKIDHSTPARSIAVLTSGLTKLRFSGLSTWITAIVDSVEPRVSELIASRRTYLAAIVNSLAVLNADSPKLSEAILSYLESVRSCARRHGACHRRLALGLTRLP